MIQAIEQRRQTMLKVMNYIVDRQRDFFEKGVQSLKPLTLREVAEVIGMHESTVSRVTNEKFVQTPRGVLPLKFFFSSGLSTTDGEDVSARGIKDQIQKLVEDEDPKNPLTDQAIVNILQQTASRSPDAPSRSIAISSACCRRGCASGSERRGCDPCRRWDLATAEQRTDARGPDSGSPCPVPSDVDVSSSSPRRTRRRTCRCSWSWRPPRSPASGRPVRGHRHRRRLRATIPGPCSSALATQYAFLRPARHRARRGIADALRTGYLHARGDVLVFYPADLQFKPEDIPRLVAPILAGRVATWSRASSRGSTKRRSSRASTTG